YSSATLARGLDVFFRELTGEGLEALILQELGHGRRLDEVCASPSEQRLGQASLARGPELLVQNVSDAVPTSMLFNMVLGLLLRSAQFVKTSAQGTWLPRLFAHSLYELEPKLGACLEVAAWPQAKTDLCEALLKEADTILALGPEDWVTSVRQKVKPGVH